MRFKYVLKGYTKLFNDNLRTPVLRTKVGICGALGLDLVLDDGHNMNYITLELVAYLGLPLLQRTYPYTMEGCKVTEGVKVSFTHGKYYGEVWCDIMPMASCHLSLGANWFTEHRVPNEHNGYKCVMDHWGTHLFPPPKDSYVGKEDLSCGRQGTIANLNTFTIANEQSVNVSLSLCEPINSLPYVDNVLIENVDTLVDHIDDRIDSSSKIDLYPPSVDTYALNASSLFCIDCVYQPVCKCSSLVEGPDNVIKEPQVGGTNENVDHLIRSDYLSISIAEDLIACFAHRDHVLENASTTDVYLSEGELACFNSSLVVDHSLFKYNIQFEDDEITPSDVPSGVNLESSIVLESYTCDSNLLCCEAFPPKDGNLFLEDESTLVGNECDEEKGGVCFSVTSSSCNPLWCEAFPPKNGNLFLEDESTLVGNECDEEKGVYVDQGILEVYTCWYDPVLWTFYPFDPGGCFKAFELVGVSAFGWYSHVVQKNDHCPCSPLVGLIAMAIEDVCLFLEFESPWLNDFNANLCITHHAKRISFLLMIYMALQGLDSRTHFYILAYDDTHTCVGCISYVSSGLNWANKNLLDSMLYDPFSFDPGVVLKCVECGSNTFCHLHDSSVVLLFDPMYFNEGMDLRTNPFQEGENDVKWITSSLSIHELQCFDGVFTRMEVVWYVWMPRRELHALHGNICTFKEIPVGKHHAWMIA
ncbi:hypothetical protein KY284_012668 [Solanum tuberosum]|nr:hypothetical protein KY284_012668 [Solanum tuberosum]